MSGHKSRLQNAHSIFPPFRFVYNACCAGYSPQLFEDVRQTVSAHLLGHVAPAVAASTTPEQFVNELLSSWQSWQTHARTLQPMFAYLVCLP